MMAQMGNVLQSFQTIVGRVDSLLAGVEGCLGNVGLFLKVDDVYKRFIAIALEGQQLLKEVRTGHWTSEPPAE